ncbi:unnamed protein product [Prunus brigantina]
MAYGPLHALAVSLGQSSPMHSAVQQGGPVHTLAVHTHLGPSNAPAASSQQYGQSNPTVSPLQAPLFPPDSHLHYDSAIVTAAHTHPGQTQGAYLVPTSSITTAEIIGLEFEHRKKFQGIEFRDLHDLINNVERGHVRLEFRAMLKPFICKGLVKADSSRTRIPDAKFATREMKAYTFDLTRAEAIFDLRSSKERRSANTTVLRLTTPTTALFCETSSKN